MSFLLLLIRAFNCHLRWLVFILTTAENKSGIVFTDYKYATPSITMPVITRSKSRMLHRCGVASSQVCLACSSGTAADLPSQHSTSTNYTSSDSIYYHATSRPTELPISSFSSLDLPLPSSDNSILESAGRNLKFETLKSVESTSTVLISKSSSQTITSNHNSSIFELVNMEADCQDLDVSQDNDVRTSAPVPSEMKGLLESLSMSLVTHISSQTTILKDQIIQNDERLQESQVRFKQEVQSELDEFRKLMDQQQRWFESRLHQISSSGQTTTTTAPTDAPILPVPTISVPSVTSSSSIPSTSTDTALHSQMMMLLSDSFSKLSSALTEQKQDSKAEWHKFTGDPKKFRAWYLGIMAHLSLPPWTELYDSSTNDVVVTTSNSALNGKLYSKILLALDGSAYQNFVSRKHLRANGIRLLRELVQTYKPRNVPEIIAAKTVEFWGNTKRSPNETIDAYYDRFHELLDDLADADEPIALKSAIRQFVFTLGPEFETIQHNFRLNNLPQAWQTQDWPTLLSLCRDFYNSVKPHMSSTRRQPTPNGITQTDREAHQKKVREWFSNPSKYCREINACQQQHPGKCIFHLSKTHTTERCFVKAECDKMLASKTSGNTVDRTVSPPGTLRHITEENDDSEELDDIVVDSLDTITNDTNEEDLFYFARMSHHYLRIANASDSNFAVSRHPMNYPVIADSGANYHMFKEREFFIDLQPAQGNVILGDGKTNIKIQGIGTVKCFISGNLVTIPNVRYIPSLGESIYSLFVHIKSPGHGLESTTDRGLFIKFPTFSSKAIIGASDIYLDIKPLTCSSSTSVDKITSIVHPQDVSSSTKVDKLLPELRHYYNEVKTRRQLKLDVPAGFRQLTEVQRLSTPTIPSNASDIIPSTTTNIPSSSIQTLSSFGFNTQHSTSGLINSDEATVVTSNIRGDQSSNQVASIHVPIIRSVDKPSSSLPATISMGEDFIKSCVGFRRVDTL